LTFSTSTFVFSFFRKYETISLVRKSWPIGDCRYIKIPPNSREIPTNSQPIMWRSRFISANLTKNYVHLTNKAFT
jgi:hypothetical protein